MRRFARHTAATLLTGAASLAAAQSSTQAVPPAGAGAAAAPGNPGVEAAAAVPSGEQTSYLFGLSFGEQIHNAGIASQVDVDAIARGIKDGLQGKQATRADQQQIQLFVRTVLTQTIERNRAAAKAFLERNAQEKGVKTTADGLEYRVLAAGDAGAAPVLPTDEVTVNYRGRLLDGTELDSSYARGMPATFKLNGVIKGWQEALVLMKPGAKWQLFIPPDLAYGASSRPGIPGGSLLLFDVELLNAKAVPPRAAPPD